MLDVLAFILLTVPLVTVHELGHLIAARALGVPCPRFSVGLGTRPAVGFDALGTRWQFTPWLLGGYVLPDMDAFRAAHPWRRIIILAAGPGANVLLAMLIIAGIALARGFDPLGAAIAGTTLTIDLTASTAAAIGSLLIGDTSSIGGPVMVAGAGGDAIQAGSAFQLAVVAAALSVGLGLANLLLPVPILDGGRIFTTTCEWLSGRSCPPKLERVLTRISTWMVAALVAFVVAIDVIRSMGG